jgi:hypothetical protein
MKLTAGCVSPGLGSVGGGVCAVVVGMSFERDQLNALLLGLQMKLVNEPMEYRRKYYSYCSYERQTTEQSIATCEELAGIRLERTERPHAGKNHRRVYERIKPGHFFE